MDEPTKNNPTTDWKAIEVITSIRYGKMDTKQFKATVEYNINLIKIDVARTIRDDLMGKKEWHGLRYSLSAEAIEQYFKDRFNV